MTRANGVIFGERPGSHRGSGNLWATLSNGRYLFSMPSNNRFDELINKVQS